LANEGDKADIAILAPWYGYSHDMLTIALSLSISQYYCVQMATFVICNLQYVGERVNKVHRGTWKKLHKRYDSDPMA